MVFDHPALVASKLAVLALGAAISTLAFMSWRRTGENLMLYLGVAFGLVAVGALLEGVLVEFLAWDLFSASTVETSLVLAGLFVLAVVLRPRGAKA